MMDNASPSHHVSANAPGWNPNMNQRQQYPVQTGPMIHPQVVQHQMAAPPTQSNLNFLHGLVI